MKEPIMNTLRYALFVCLLAGPAWAQQNATSSEQSAETVSFRFAPKVGEVTRTTIATKTSGSMNMFGSMLTQKFSQNYEQDIVLKCTEIKPDGTSVFEMTLPAVAMKMNMGGFSIEVDTRDENPPAATQPVFDIVRRLFTAMTRLECTVTFSPEGEPLKLEGLSEGMDSIMKEFSSQLMPGLGQLFDQFRDYLADDIMAEQMRSVTRMMPDDGKARVGDKWTREWQVKLPPFNVMTQGKGEYEFLGMEEFRGRRCAKIRVKSSLTTMPGQKPDGAKLGVPKGIFDRMELSMNSSGGNGIAYLDPATGDLLQMRETQRTTLEISMAPDPQAEEHLQEGIGKITQKLTTSVQINLVEKNGKPLR
jgi:hypothetical protein